MSNRCGDIMHSVLDELMHETGAKLGSDAMDYMKPQLHLLKGSARKEIPALAKRLQVDCIIMGTVARTGVPGFIMGNTAETILEQIDCSVLSHQAARLRHAGYAGRLTRRADAVSRVGAVSHVESRRRHVAGVARPTAADRLQAAQLFGTTAGRQ